MLRDDVEMISGQKKSKRKLILFDKISENKNGNRRRNKNRNGSCRTDDVNALTSYDDHRLT
jgi:hypothetical protein